MGVPAANAAGVASIPAGSSVLFTLEAHGGTFVPLGHDRYRLTLRGVGAQTTWFSDRPRRDAGRVTTRSLLQGWRRLGFAADPPNGAAVLDGGRSGQDTVALELRLRSFDPRRHVARFAVRVLPSVGRGLAHLEHRLDTRLPRRFGGVSLFLDNGTLDGGCVLGQPQLFGFSFRAADDAHVLADGRLLPIDANNGLYSIYGTRYGGDGRTTFALPTMPAPLPGMSWQVCVEGDFPVPSAMEDCVTGELDLWAFSPGQAGQPFSARWLPADGRTVTRAAYPVFADGYGIGAQQATFALPDLTAPPGMAWFACVAGEAPSASAEIESLIGQADLYAAHDGIGVPAGRIPGGELVQIQAQVLLYQLLGTSFGGDGQSTFATPAPPSPAPGLAWLTEAQGVFPYPNPYPGA